jgi:hypothetical protein
VNCPGRSNRRCATRILLATTLSGSCLLTIGCTTPAFPAGRLNVFSRNYVDRDLAHAVRNDPFPSAAESGLSPGMPQAR